MSKHYVTTDESGRVLRGFSDGFEQPEASAICINKDGGKHFELNGVVNPPMIDMNGVSLFKFDGGIVVARSQEELDADKPVSVPVPTIEERVQVIELAVKELATNGVGTAELEAALAEIEAVLNG